MCVFGYRNSPKCHGRGSDDSATSHPHRALCRIWRAKEVAKGGLVLQISVDLKKHLLVFQDGRIGHGQVEMTHELGSFFRIAMLDCQGAQLRAWECS